MGISRKNHSWVVRACEFSFLCISFLFSSFDCMHRTLRCMRRAVGGVRWMHRGTLPCHNRKLHSKLSRSGEIRSAWKFLQTKIEAKADVQRKMCRGGDVLMTKLTSDLLLHSETHVSKRKMQPPQHAQHARNVYSPLIFRFLTTRRNEQNRRRFGTSFRKKTKVKLVKWKHHFFFAACPDHCARCTDADTCDECASYACTETLTDGTKTCRGETLWNWSLLFGLCLELAPAAWAFVLRHFAHRHTLLVHIRACRIQKQDEMCVCPFESAHKDLTVGRVELFAQVENRVLHFTSDATGTGCRGKTCERQGNSLFCTSCADNYYWKSCERKSQVWRLYLPYSTAWCRFWLPACM